MPEHKHNLDRAAYTVAETAKLIGISRTKLYQLVSEGKIRMAKIGNASRFLTVDICAFLDSLIVEEKGETEHP